LIFHGTENSFGIARNIYRTDGINYCVMANALPANVLINKLIVLKCAASIGQMGELQTMSNQAFFEKQ
jgi:hypothetical protein